MNERKTESYVKSYLYNKLSDEGLNSRIIESISIVLAGSAALGITDKYSDWDLHLLLPDTIYSQFQAQMGNSFVIDDKEHCPIIFAVFRPLTWLEERMKHRAELYLWIYSNASVIYDPNNQCQQLIEIGRATFSHNLGCYLRDHYVKYRSLRNSLKNCILRSDAIAISLIKSEVVSTAMQTMSLLLGKPYPYTKWLKWHMNQCGSSASETVNLSKQFIQASDENNILLADRNLKDHIVNNVSKLYTNADWVEKWWCYIQN